MQATLGPAAVGPALAADTPFRLQVAPHEAVPHPGWRRARAIALAALGRGERVALLGPPGAGKTLLLRDLAQALRREGRSVRLVESGDALDPVPGEDVLLVDEAGRMGEDALARLCATDKPFVLAAIPGSAERLAGLARPIKPVALEPLPPEEVARFIAARLSAAGRPRDMLEPDAVLALARHSAGLPRLVNVLGGAAVFLAELEGAPHVCRQHVEEAAAMRDGEGGRAAEPAQPSPEPPTAGAAPRAELPVASRVPPQARRGRLAVSAAVAATTLGLVLAGGWAVSGWQPPVRSLEARLPEGNGVSGSPRGDADGEALGTQPDGSGHDAVERPHNVASTPAPEEAPQQAAQTGPPDAGAAALRQWPATDSAPVVVAAFSGPVFNETLNRGGQMSLVVTRQRGASSGGAVMARFEAWDGLLGSGELAGRLSEDGRLSASGRLMVGKNPFDCDLSGRITGGRLTGSATFVRSGGGRTSRSTFSLTGS